MCNTFYTSTYITTSTNTKTHILLQTLIKKFILVTQIIVTTLYMQMKQEEKEIQIDIRKMKTGLNQVLIPQVGGL